MIQSLLSRKPWNLLGPWLAGLIVASCFCSGYVLMNVYRKKWQNHYPALAAEWANNGRFALIGWYGTELANEELAYSARAVEASRHFPAYDPYIKENRAFRQAVVDAFSYGVMGLVHRVTGEINRTWLALRFMACLFWFVLIYFIMLRCGQAPAFAGFCATFVSAFSYILLMYFTAHLDLGNPAKSLWVMLSYGRTESVLRLPRPGVTYGFLFFATWLAIKSVEKPGWAWALASGLMAGVMAYVRLDVWTSHCIALALFTFAWSWREKKIRPELAVALVIGAVLSLPYLASNYPPEPDLLVRSGVIARRQFDLWSPFYLLMAVLAWRSKKGATELFLGSLCAATFLMVNLELATGFSLCPEHWKWFGNIYVFLLAMALLPGWLKSMEWPWALGSVGLTTVCLLQSLSYAAIHFPFQGLPKDYDEALVWLKQNAKEDSVVFSLSPEVQALLPVYANMKPMAGYPLAVVSTYPLYENYRRFAAGARLMGVDAGKLMDDTYFAKSGMNDRREVVASGLIRGEIEKHDFSSLFCSAPIDYARDIVARERKAPLDLAPDFIWMGNLERSYSPKTAPFLRSKDWTEAYRNPQVTLYRRK